MQRSKYRSSIPTCSEPFGKVTELMPVPMALFEILALAGEIDDPKAKQIASLAGDAIEVTLDDPEELVKISRTVRGMEDGDLAITQS